MRSDIRDSISYVRENSFHMLDSIVQYIRQKVPFSGILSSENIITPSTGEVWFRHKCLADKHTHTVV